jgi:SAM-dependent methyltransferase
LLSADIQELIEELPRSTAAQIALDLGCDKSPYKELLEKAGFQVKTLDITPDSRADYLGTAEVTGIPNASVDLVLCTQVLEHCDAPSKAMAEIRRILAPGGHVIFSVPHVWFYHPHPSDSWRFTQEGVLKLCQEAGLQLLVLLAQGGTVATAFQIANFLLYGVVGQLGAPLYAGVNAVAKVLDRLVPNELFCHNFACLARSA